MLDTTASLRHRMPTNAQSVFTFSHVFQPDTPQAVFFAETTLDLVRNFLFGSNGLLFTYGVTNSGKTYTIQGGKDPSSVGLLPRTLDVIFNSLDGLHSNLPVCETPAFSPKTQLKKICLVSSVSAFQRGES